MHVDAAQTIITNKFILMDMDSANYWSSASIERISRNSSAYELKKEGDILLPFCFLLVCYNKFEKGNNMSVHTEYIELSTKGNAQVVDVTDDVSMALESGKIKRGIVTVSVIGSTGAMTTCEYEPGLVKDISDTFDKLIPQGNYHHDQAWGDGNGHSHLRSSVIGPSVTLPFEDKRLIVGTWQQIIFIDFDNRARQRQLVIQIIGE